jgi:hypothetical protein
LAGITAYAHAQQVWAAQAIGVVTDAGIKRHTTAACLNALKQVGVID